MVHKFKIVLYFAFLFQTTLKMLKYLRHAAYTMYFCLGRGGEGRGGEGEGEGEGRGYIIYRHLSYIKNVSHQLFVI